ncbi:hypothetical protein [Mesobacillus jeotgali]|uniref:hypothetical protein n=1 Tax=Mesobacillus jeotgali TaxID=129985 RepID=UPI001CFD6C14|nr:hypothetical protein [Mesobacillus jeotgali]
MSSITEAYYKNNDQIQIINISDVTAGDYTDKYKGKLYCTTNSCTAQLSYVYREGNRSYFRTWRESPHTEQCIYYFEKLKDRSGNRHKGYQDGIVSQEQIRRSLREAFENENMSITERNDRREKQREARIRRNRERIRRGSTEQPAHRIVSDPSRITDDTTRTGVRLYKRDADALKEVDLGQTRTVTGILKSIEYGESNAVMRIEKNRKNVTIKFEEVFFSTNLQYRGMFHHIKRFMEEYDEIIFSATGEVRTNKSGEYELIVFDGIGFLIHGRSLASLASEYAIRDNVNK